MDETADPAYKTGFELGLSIAQAFMNEFPLHFEMESLPDGEVSLNRDYRVSDFVREKGYLGDCSVLEELEALAMEKSKDQVFVASLLDGADEGFTAEVKRRWTALYGFR